MDKELRQRLSWLDQELLKEAYAELEEDWEEEAEEEDTPRRIGKGNRAVYFQRAQFADEEFDESTAVLVEKKKRKKKDKTQPKRKGIGDLVFLACLEVAGILAVIWWWLRWLI